MKRHLPIMVTEILEFIPNNAKLILDGTFGHGGHSLALSGIYQNSSSSMEIIGMERDPKVIEHGKEYITQEYKKEFSGQGIVLLSDNLSLRVINDSYTCIEQYLDGKQADFILLDLGINREHVTDNIRGFSIQGEGPLDMRFTPKITQTAYQLIKSSTLDVIKSWFLSYADFNEKRATTIATLISNNKNNPRLNSTLGFIEILQEIKIHKKELAPLFQAIRIATNHEFENIHTFMSSLDTILAYGGRCAIMTFHSIEDRIVKYHFKDLSQTGRYTILTKHVIVPHYTEVQKNKASRSAKLRVIERNL